MNRNLFQYHPVIGYTFIPGIKARVSHEGGGFLVKANQAGFRCEHEVTKKKPENTYRILLFGDSYTAGEGVSNKYRFGDLLEKRFPGTEVLNFGLPGSGTDQQYLIFKEFAKDIDYDLLLICPLAENIRRNMARYRLSRSAETGELSARAKPYFTMENNALRLNNSPVPKITLTEKDMKDNPELKQYIDEGGRHPVADRLLRKAPNIKDKLQKTLGYQPFPEYNDKDSPGWVLMKKLLKTWTEEAKKPMICPIPVYHYIENLADPGSFQKRFKELEQDTKIKVGDLLPRFWKESKDTRRRCRFKNDQHPTPLGHEIIADGISQYIKGTYETWKKA